MLLEVQCWKRIILWSTIIFLNEFGENDLEVNGIKTVNSAKSKFVMVDSDKFSLSWTLVKAILPSPMKENEGRNVVHLFLGSVNMKKKFFLIQILQSLNKKCM